MSARVPGSSSATASTISERLMKRRRLPTVPARFEKPIRVVLVVLLVLGTLLWFVDWRQDVADRREQDAATAAAASMTTLLTFGPASAISDLETEAALLTEEFAAEYVPTVRAELEQAADDGLRVSAVAEVKRTGVVRTVGDDVEVLLFITLTRTVEGQADTNVIFPKMKVTMTHLGGDWLIADSETL